MLNFKFRLYPTREQEQRFADILEINRIVYNYLVLNNSRNRNDMNYALTELKEQQPILRRYHSKMLQMISTKVAGAWEGMNELKEKGFKVGDKLYFLKLRERNSFAYNQSGFRIETCTDGKTLLWLAKIGHIEIRIHRRLYDIAQVTVIKQACKWFAVVTCKMMRKMQSSIIYSKPVGIAVGITNYAYDSNGGHIDNPLFTKQDLKKMRRSNKTLSRRVYGSNNYKKALRWHQRLHMGIANKRKNFLHNLSTEYSRKYDLIFVEKLHVRNMNRNHCLARHIMDSSWSMFKQMLQYKANRVIEVDPYHTSVECSKCGNLVPKALAIRIHECDRCGMVLNRDHNAAINILQKRLKILQQLPMQHGEVTPVETLCRVAEAGISPHRFRVDS